MIRRMAKAFEARRRVMDRALTKHKLKVAGGGAFGGSSLWIETPEEIDTNILAKRLESQGVLIEPGQTFFDAADAPKRFFRIAYSSIPEDKIEAGISLIAAEVQNML